MWKRMNNSFIELIEILDNFQNLQPTYIYYDMLVHIC